MAGVDTEPQTLSGRRLEGRVAAVTGASSGVGRAIAVRLATEGATVVCGDLQAAPAAAGLDGEHPTDALIRAEGGTAEFVEWDVSQAAHARRSYELALEKFGRLDVVVANAGVALPGGSLFEEDEATWQRHLNVNLTGSWNTVRFGLRTMREAGAGGKIIVVSSVAGILGIAGVASGYAVTKAAIIELAKQAAVDGAPSGITANALCPGYLRSAINATVWSDERVAGEVASQSLLGRWGDAGDVSGMAAFLASEDADWVTGATFVVDGGLTCV